MKFEANNKSFCVRMYWWDSVLLIFHYGYLNKLSQKTMAMAVQRSLAVLESSALQGKVKKNSCDGYLQAVVGLFILLLSRIRQRDSNKAAPSLHSCWRFQGISVIQMPSVVVMWRSHFSSQSCVALHSLVQFVAGCNVGLSLQDHPGTCWRYTGGAKGTALETKWPGHPSQLAQPWWTSQLETIEKTLMRNLLGIQLILALLYGV